MEGVGYGRVMTEAARRFAAQAVGARVASPRRPPEPASPRAVDQGCTSLCLAGRRSSRRIVLAIEAARFFTAHTSGSPLQLARRGRDLAAQLRGLLCEIGAG